MRRVRCYECGKRYDFDVDDFCPKCGAFNQPDRASRIDADGNVVRVDGLNEANHRNSFVHSELHEENKERRAAGLSKSTKRVSQKTAQPVLRQRQKQAGSQSIGTVIKWIIVVIIGLNILSSILSGLF